MLGQQPDLRLRQHARLHSDCRLACRRDESRPAQAIKIGRTLKRLLARVSGVAATRRAAHRHPPRTGPRLHEPPREGQEWLERLVRLVSSLFSSPFCPISLCSFFPVIVPASIAPLLEHFELGSSDSHYALVRRCRATLVGRNESQAGVHTMLCPSYDRVQTRHKDIRCPWSTLAA